MVQDWSALPLQKGLAKWQQRSAGPETTLARSSRRQELTNERLAGRLGVSVRTIAYWRKEASGVLPDLAQRALTEALDNTPERLRLRFEQLRSTPPPVTGEIDEVLATAAREADADSALLAGSIDPESLDWLWEQSLEIARAGHRPAFETFRAAQSVRRNALELVQRTRHPGTISDLYVIAGQATALMASTAFDLNRWDASATLARSAVSYASLVGNPLLAGVDARPGRTRWPTGATSPTLR